MMRKIYLLVTLLVLVHLDLLAQHPAVLSQRAQADVVEQRLEERIEYLLPELMDRAGVDMWVLISREYNEDPVIRTFLPATWFAARRRTMLVIHKADNQDKVEAIAVARYDVGKAFKKAWDPEVEPDQWKALSKVIEERNPKAIAVNFSDTYGHADGISVSDFELLKSNLSKELNQRIVSGEKLAVGWLETRTPSEMATYRHMQTIANEIIAEGLSEDVITPGVTTTEDVVWWYRERIKERKLDTWFQPTVDLQRSEKSSSSNSKQGKMHVKENVIQPGDLLHIDFGITYLRLNTDTQQLAYVLKQDEMEVPAYLQAGLKVGNRLQDILTSQFVAGRTGNEILKETRAVMAKENIKGSIYSHPLGYHGHASGPTIGMWDNQGDTKGAGDYPLYPNTAYAIELSATVHVEEWGKDVVFQLEEGAYFDGEKVIYFDGRQKEIMAIPRVRPYLRK
ncbi:M24 family metallopeptidase [Belliella kenyensis]|uniref:M24 family metallopeptidase n=1 Tax=Belliella kenyensis TaxID=1472724 RepID=A0ABV8ENF3_9BACT|nr:M24 family metallopeptidase [Belliella kenyensis]MCH7402978.1 aminopeptidase P family protein [Belliella kenyensis]MDN3605014.1 M24 family metallopeptidase [Belliella kenyensis]